MGNALPPPIPLDDVATEAERAAQDKQQRDQHAEPMLATDACIESQRLYPLAGWADALLPTDCAKWANEATGDAVRGLDDHEFPHPPCACGANAPARGAGACSCDQWRWRGGWHLDLCWQPDMQPPSPRSPRSPTSPRPASESDAAATAVADPHGWRYGHNFGRVHKWRRSGRERHQAHDLCRQRRWTRTRENVTQARRAVARCGVALLRLASCEAECVVCFDAQRDALFVHGDSGHQCCCMRCARESLHGDGSSDECPICRQSVEGVAHVPPPSAAQAHGERRCLLCGDAPQDAVLLHEGGKAGHCSTCFACAQNIVGGAWRRRCPVCGEKVSKAVRVFHNSQMAADEE